MFTLPPLPWAKNALEAKGFSEEQISYHYEKHHQGYVTKLNAAAESNADLKSKSIEELISSQKGPIFNLAAQIFNHTFYWSCMSPNGGGHPTGAIADKINEDFGSFDDFKTKFSAAATNHFGSGWAWLVQDTKTKKLSIHETHDAGCPLTDGFKPILACDVWEHAYYVSFRNDRAKYIQAWWNCVDWSFANTNLIA